jgi:sugar phosphate isomerase/epimerase
MKFAICNETFQGWEWERTCRYVAEAGYDGIEIAPFTLAEDVRSICAERRREIHNIAGDSGLEIVGLHWLLVSPKGMSMTSSDAGVRRATGEYLSALADFCGDVGGRIMVFGSPAQRRTGSWTRFARRWIGPRSAASPSAWSPCRSQRRTTCSRSARRSR